ncbi:MAG: GAF domain-containing protein [Candidatus Handelsmanbacteria bacterium]|nr:GAF domain-containing protein [Candidatus Handelsmanbacteria bacterium]
MAEQRHSAFDLEDRLRRLNGIGVALSVERNLTVLLERILQEARSFTRADAGTLFLLKGEHLSFEIAQNDTLKSFAGGTHGKMDMPPVPLNRESVSGYVAVTGKVLNIEDVYTDPVYRFEGPKNYDRMTGYRTRSILGVPMKDHEDQIIGVLQLLNALHPRTGEVLPFSAEDQSLIQSLASQAAVAINNVLLIEETERLFDSFVEVMATAIDERSPYTGGHIRRVAEMAMAVAHAVNTCQEGPLGARQFSEDELNELRIASWMHDIGKITTPEWVVDKPTKLHTLFDRIKLVRTRFALIRKIIELERRQQEAAGPLSADLTAQYADRLRALDEDLVFLERANTPGEFMQDADLERLRQIAAQTYRDGDQEKPYLSADELHNLCIRKGSLTAEERQKINDHASMSIKMLAQIPFTRKLAQVPPIAGAHHEKLDGTGYPLGRKAGEISLQARILALVDIFDSLSADDRPYRATPMPREVVLRILREEVEATHIDRDLYELFIREELYLKLDEIKARMARTPPASGAPKV